MTKQENDYVVRLKKIIADTYILLIEDKPLAARGLIEASAIVELEMQDADSPE